MASPAAISTHERFDMNTVTIAGIVQRIRPFNAHHVLVHMASGENRVTIALPEEHDITMMVGERITVHGWLEDVPYDESFSAFLQRAGKSDLLEKYTELAGIRDQTIQRVLTVVTPETTQSEPVGDDVSVDDPDNAVRIEGIIVRAWAYSNNLYARLAIYDKHADSLAEDGNNGLPKRQARYVTVQFTDSRVDGRQLKIGGKASMDVIPGVIHRNDRVRISGSMKGRVYVESMRDWLGRAKRTDITSQLPNADMLLDGVKARYGQVVIEATRLIQFG
jgi:hypothetical protein